MDNVKTLGKVKLNTNNKIPNDPTVKSDAAEARLKIGAYLIDVFFWSYTFWQVIRLFSKRLSWVSAFRNLVGTNH